jgi:hypothetical protein
VKPTGTPSGFIDRVEIGTVNFTDRNLMESIGFEGGVK